MHRRLQRLADRGRQTLGPASGPGRAPGLQDCVASRVQARWPDALVVHRLDMATSGLMLMARGPAQRMLSAAFERREVDKRYVARVAGRSPPVPGAGWAEIDLPIAADWPARPRRKIDAVNGKPARTRCRVLEHGRDADGMRWTRVELRPETGRTHQLRVHLSAIGHPILGDTLYAARGSRGRRACCCTRASRVGRSGTEVRSRSRRRAVLIPA